MSFKDSRVVSYFRARLGPFVIALAIIAAQIFIAEAVGFGGNSFTVLLPLVTAVFLLLSIFVYSDTHDRMKRWVRILLLAQITWLLGMNVICMAWFVYDMFNPQTVTLAHQLLLAGIALWVVNVGVFALAYWELDAGGPEARNLGEPSIFRGKMHPDFVFPQQETSNDCFAAKDWQPGFTDYLYVSVTTATSFAPAAATPYSRMSKMMLSSEALISFLTLGLIIARAISL